MYGILLQHLFLCSASEVMTLRRYTNLFIIIIVVTTVDNGIFYRAGVNIFC